MIDSKVQSRFQQGTHARLHFVDLGLAGVRGVLGWPVGGHWLAIPIGGPIRTCNRNNLSGPSNGASSLDCNKSRRMRGHLVSLLASPVKMSPSFRSKIAHKIAKDDLALPAEEVYS